MTKRPRLTLEEMQARAMRKQLKAFRKKFGRDPLPHEPVFFDPKSDVPKQIESEEFDRVVLDALQKSGARPQIIYAFKKTGLLGVEGKMDLWEEDAKREWNEAIDEYFRMEGDAAKGEKS